MRVWPLWIPSARCLPLHRKEDRPYRLWITVLSLSEYLVQFMQNSIKFLNYNEIICFLNDKFTIPVEQRFKSIFGSRFGFLIVREMRPCFFSNDVRYFFSFCVSLYFICTNFGVSAIGQVLSNTRGNYLWGGTVTWKSSITRPVLMSSMRLSSYLKILKLDGMIPDAPEWIPSFKIVTFTLCN